MYATYSRRILLSKARSTHGGSTVGAVWAQYFHIHPPLMVSSATWLQVVTAWLFYGETDIILDSLGCESARPMSMWERRGAPMCVDKNWIIDFRPAGFRSNIYMIDDLMWSHFLK